MYENKSTGAYPKTLVVRNTIGGMIWQVYHIDNESQAYYLARNASGNGFLGITLEDYKEDIEETFPDWRKQTANQLVKLLPNHLAVKPPNGISDKRIKMRYAVMAVNDSIFYEIERRIERIAEILTDAGYPEDDIKGFTREEIYPLYNFIK